MRVTSRIAAWIALWIACVLVLAAPVVAYAHDRLKSSVPAADTTLTIVPRELRLNFSEVPNLTFTWIQLYDAAGHPVLLSPVVYAADSKRAVIAAVRGALVAGRYTIQWQVVGDDGHPTRDTLHFVIAAGASGIGVVPPAPAGDAHLAGGGAPLANHLSLADAKGFDVESPLYVAIRWITFITLLLVIGAAAFRQLVLRSLGQTHAPDAMLDDAARRAAHIGYRASLVFLLALVLRLFAQSMAMNGRPNVFNFDLLGAVLRHGAWGLGWHLQFVGVLVAGLGFDRAAGADLATARSSRGWLAAAIGVGLLSFASGLAGHAAAAPKLGALTLVADGFHVLGAGGWLGTLTVMLLAGIPAALALPDARRADMVAALVNAFSPTALVFAGIVAVTGVFAAWIHVGSIPALWQTPYGNMLFRKLVILSVAVAAGAYNWLRIRPALSRGESVVLALRRSATVEIIVGVLVLLVTAILVAMPTTMDMK